MKKVIAGTGIFMTSIITIIYMLVAIATEYNIVDFMYGISIYGFKTVFFGLIILGIIGLGLIIWGLVENDK